MILQCPHCKSAEIVAGELRNDQGLNGAGNPAFFLPTTRGKLFVLSEPCIYPDKTAAICLKCGLLWTHVDPHKAEKLNEKYGS